MSLVAAGPGWWWCPAGAAAARAVRDVGAVLVLGFAGMVLYTKAAPLVPALNSYWLKIHVSAAATASGLSLVGFVPAALFLVRGGFERASGGSRIRSATGCRPGDVGAADFPGARLRVPDLDLRRDLRRDLGRGGVGPLLGLGSEGDVVVRLLGGLRALPARPGHPEREADDRDLVAVAAWATMLINLYVINFVAVGLHSYAGVVTRPRRTSAASVGHPAEPGTAAGDLRRLG